MGGLALGDLRKRRRRETIVLKQRDLEGENGFGFGVTCLARQQAEPLLGCGQRVDQCLMFLGRRAALPDIVPDSRQAHERSQCDTGGGRPPLDALGGPMRSMVHPESPRLQASPAHPMPPLHRPPRRENRSSNPSAPW